MPAHLRYILAVQKSFNNEVINEWMTKGATKRISFIYENATVAVEDPLWCSLSTSGMRAHLVSSSYALLPRLPLPNWLDRIGWWFMTKANQNRPYKLCLLWSLWVLVCQGRSRVCLPLGAVFSDFPGWHCDLPFLAGLELQALSAHPSFSLLHPGPVCT